MLQHRIRKTNDVCSLSFADPRTLNVSMYSDVTAEKWEMERNHGGEGKEGTYEERIIGDRCYYGKGRYLMESGGRVKQGTMGINVKKELERWSLQRLVLSRGK